MVFKNKITKIRSTDSSKEQGLISHERLAEVLDSVDHGVVLYSNTGQQQFCNEAASQMVLPHGRVIQDRLYQSGDNSFVVNQPFNTSIKGRVVDLGEEGFLLIAKPQREQFSQTHKLFAHLMRKPWDNTDPFAHAARALGLACDWRWVGVSRFTDQASRHAEFAGWWDGVTLKPAFSVSSTELPYSLLGIDEFRSVPADLLQPINSSPWQLDEGESIKAFAGFVYCVNEIPCGQIVALDTKPHLNIEEMEAMQRVVADYLTTVDSIAHTVSANVEEGGRTDPLTHFGDRQMFNTKKRRLVNAYLKGMLADLLLVDIELKRSDKWTADADEASILACAEMTRKACRPNDWFFRPSTNRFQLLLPGLSVNERQNATKRIADAARLLQGVDCCVHDIVFGLSFLSENNGKIEQAELLAAESRQDMSYQRSVQLAVQ